MTSNRLIAFRTIHAMIAAVVAGSLIIQVALLFTGGADANSGDTDADVGVATRLVRLLSYFTIQSNLIVLAVSILLAINPLRTGTRFAVGRFDALLGITVTGLVFAIVLAPQVHLTGAALVATIGFHYISPWATLLAWLLFGPRRQFGPAVIGWAFAWPVAWLLYTFVRGAFVDWYPYPFLDVTEIGYARALLNAVVVLILGAVLAALFRLVDRRAPALLDQTSVGPTSR
ncbi:Pr6Pr family membrane protein [Gordonia sp. LSe1-13]|uniref:Pr6Pr family membrane protein n=1 Tax=Gordonia sesuvii TaxID=3116777 RepID=A0ABU7MHZ6_9ACTN|nr:Pr6Pr family membrane protein [Gordonia sp. LSe1-13]